MKQVSYWLDTAPAFPDRTGRPLDPNADAVVVGGGITGLSAGIALARKGARLAVLEQRKVGFGASGRNGGMCNTGLKLGPANTIERYGVEAARRYYDAYRDAVEFVSDLVRDERIDCDFRRSGRLGLAARREHFDRQRVAQRLLAEKLGHETFLIPPSELRAEIDSDFFHGALLDPLSAGLHPGKYVNGLAEAAERAGAQLHEGVRVASIKRELSGGFMVKTTAGAVRTKQVLLATDGYTDATFPKLRRRMVMVGSFILVTEQLGGQRARALVPNDRMLVDTKNVNHYFRLTPDRRLLFGGRARFAPSNPESDRKSAQVLQRDMLAVFPQLAGVGVDYVWGGSVGIAADQMPHAGELGGLYYSGGYAGHGVQMASYMGCRMAEVMDGHPEANPWRDLPFWPLPTYSGTDWFLPLVGAYFRLKDRFG